MKVNSFIIPSWSSDMIKNLIKVVYTFPCHSWTYDQAIFARCLIKLGPLVKRKEDDLVQKFLIEDYLSTYQNERRIKLAARDRKLFLLTTWLLLISDDLCVFRRRGFRGVYDKLDIIWLVLDLVTAKLISSKNSETKQIPRANRQTIFTHLFMYFFAIALIKRNFKAYEPLIFVPYQPYFNDFAIQTP